MKIELAAFFVFVAWVAIALNLILGPSITTIACLVAFYAIGAATSWVCARYKGPRRRTNQG